MSIPLTRQSRIIVPAILFFTAVLFYDILLDGLLSLLHSAFELIEHALDSLVEHLFHTSHHTTETIVFYILAAVFGFALYSLIRAIPLRAARLKEGLIGFYCSEKSTALNFWHSRSRTEKSKFGAICLAGAILFVLWMFL